MRAIGMAFLVLMAALALGLGAGSAPLDAAPSLPEQDLAAGPIDVSVGHDGVRATGDIPVELPLDVDTSLLPCATCPILSIEAGSDPAADQPKPASQGPADPLQALRDTPSAVLFAGSSLLATVLAVAAWFLRPALGLFSRIEDGDLASHPMRRQALDYIAANPGATLQDVRRSLGVAWGTAVYHLGRLERAGQVAVRHVGGRRGHWPLGQAPARDALPESGRALAALVLAEPGLPQGELARRTGILAPAACKHLARLESAGLVAARREGKQRLYVPTRQLAATLA